MRVLFVHQNFPGQYIHIVQKLAKQGGHQIVALGIQSMDTSRMVPDSVHYFRYPLKRGNAEDAHPLVVETESKVIRAEAVAEAAWRLKGKGFVPDLICVHPCRGEDLFLSTVWTQVPMLSYQ